MLLKFDLATVFETDIIQSLARQTGWDDTDDKYSIEAWQLWATKKNICVYFNLETDTTISGTRFIKGVLLSDFNIVNVDNANDTEINSNTDIESTVFTIPLSMCKDEFLTKIMKTCGYAEDRYGRDTVIKYLIQCQLQDKDDSYSRITIKVNKWNK